MLLFTSTGWAECPPDPEVVAALQSLRDAPCYGIAECLDAQLRDIERLQAERPDALLLHRMRQELELAGNAHQREAARSDLVERYRDHPALSRQASRYLVARLENDPAGLQAAAEEIPWARLDLMRRQLELDGKALVDIEEAERQLEAFVSECPGASELLAAEVPQLLVSARWPVWTEVRRHLLNMNPPPWKSLNRLMIRSGLLQDAEGDPAGNLLAELEATTGVVYREDAGYWLYRARIHHEARDIDSALEANARARQIDPCRQLPPLQRLRPDNGGELSAEWFAQVNAQIMDCPPDFETYQAWLIAATQEPGRIRERALARIRRAIEGEALGFDTPRLAKGLARLDICCTGHAPEAAWETLERLFQRARDDRDRMVADGIGAASRAVSLSLSALSLAKLALENDYPVQAEEWRRRSDQLFEASREIIEQTPGMQQLVSLIEADRSEFEWLKARKAGRHADAVVHALTARARQHPWIDMDEVMASWQAAGGTEEGFERLLAVWELELSAKWRGWRRLEEPLQDFELADMQERVWTLDHLDGKRTLVNLWAVWCGPCLLELPKVQELHERYRDDPDVQVLTVNLDRVEGVARELIRREGYDFPVLMHGSAGSPFEDVGIPRNWLVSAEGVRRWEQTGFSPDIADHWVEDIVSLLERMD